MNFGRQSRRTNVDSGTLYDHLRPILLEPRIYNSVVRKPNYSVDGNVTCDLCKQSVGAGNYVSCDSRPNTDLCQPCFAIVQKLAAPFVTPPRNVTPVDYGGPVHPTPSGLPHFGYERGGSSFPYGPAVPVDQKSSVFGSVQK